MSVPNQLAALEPTRLQVQAWLAPRMLPQRVLDRMDLVLEEMLMNRLWHAFPQEESRQTTLSVVLTADALHLQFEDAGLPFNPLAHPEAPAPSSLAEAGIGGLGLKLVRKAASHCAYEYTDGMNRFSVTLALQ